MIPSYTPTLSAMLSASQSIGPLKVMTVIQPHTPGQRSLPFTRDESKNIKKYVPSESWTEIGSSEHPTSIDDVLFHLKTVSIAHFACHGEQDLKSPLDSALLLSDGRLKMSRLMEEPLFNAHLAFLSACQTATGASEVPDEAIHLAATMLYAGFRGVVGTMW